MSIYFGPQSLTLGYYAMIQLACVKLITDSVSIFECITVCYCLIINNPYDYYPVSLFISVHRS